MKDLTLILVACLALGLGACASGGTSASDATSSAVTQTGDGLTEAALSPLEDLNLRRTDIPDRIEVLETPYGVPAWTDCASLEAEIAELTVILGPDDDMPAGDEEERDRAQWAADRSADAALGAVASTARGFIPFRGLVREATGAERYADKLANAYRLGMERRAYLKGYGQALGCSAPAAPEPPPEETPKIVYAPGSRG
ncbi:MAG: hypothetical protein AAFR33_10580 [Pseudomonadota bacterium]